MTISIHYLADRPEFSDAVVRYYLAQWGYKYPERRFEDWRKKVYLGRKIPVTFIALDNSDQRQPQLVGTVALHHQGIQDADKTSIWLTALYVINSHRQRGIATALMARALQHAQRLGVKKWHLFTHSGGKLYTKLGWKITGRETIKGQKVLIMQQDIVKSPAILTN